MRRATTFDNVYSMKLAEPDRTVDGDWPKKVNGLVHRYQEVFFFLPFSLVRLLNSIVNVIQCSSQS